MRPTAAPGGEARSGKRKKALAVTKLPPVYGRGRGSFIIFPVPRESPCLGGLNAADTPALTTRQRDAAFLVLRTRIAERVECPTFVRTQAKGRRERRGMTTRTHFAFRIVFIAASN